MEQIESVQNKQRTVAFIVARLNSSRLPAKQFRKIGGKSIIEWIVDSLRQSDKIDDIVITTVAAPENLPLRNFAEENDLSCFWYEGDVDHVTSRLSAAAKSFNAEICVLVSGDCPLIYAPAIDSLVCELQKDPDADYVSVEPDESGQVASQEGVFVARQRAWRNADDLSDRPELKEHFFPIIFQRPDVFKARKCFLPKDVYFAKHRFSVDTWADLEFMERIYSELYSLQGESFELPNVVKLLRKKPQLMDINSHVHQRALVEDIKQVLFVVDSGGRFGYGHLMRSMELALQITEWLSWPVTFLVDDEKAAQLVEERGMRVVWGAWERRFDVPDCGCWERFDRSSMSCYSIVIVDIYWKRDLEANWRVEFLEVSVLVLNRHDSWALKADRIVIPEVCSAGEIGGKAKGGIDYIIIRREIRNARSAGGGRNIDMLAYLSRPEHRRTVRRYADLHGLSVKFVDGFRDDFPQQLAHSRFFISGFGYSFYEALYLGTIPVALPFSPEHRDAATFFYEKVGMSPLIVYSERELQKIMEDAGEGTSQVSVEDGTKRIVDIVAELGFAQK